MNQLEPNLFTPTKFLIKELFSLPILKLFSVPI